MKHKRSLISVAMVTIMVVSLCAVCASPLTVRAADSSSANVQSALVGAPAGIAGAPAVCKPYVYGNYIALFVRGNDGALWWTNWKGATWSAWESLGGYLTSSPAAAALPTLDFTGNSIDVFVRGGDGALWQRTYGNNAWSGWKGLGGQLASGTGPATDAGRISVYQIGRLDVFVEGTDAGLWHRVKIGTWSGWQSLGGKLTSSPGAADVNLNFGSQQIDVFVRGTDAGLWQKYYVVATNQWSGWRGM